MRTWLWRAAIVLALFLAATRPTQSAHLIRSIGNGLMSAADGIAAFLTKAIAG